MEILEMTYTIGNNGYFNIPAKVLRQMGLGPGDHVRIAYLTDQSQENIFREFLLTADSLAEAENCSHIAVPRELLRQAEIPEDADIQVICSPGAIILAQDPILDVDALREVLSSMNIAAEILEQLPEDTDDALDALQDAVEEMEGKVHTYTHE